MSRSFPPPAFAPLFPSKAEISPFPESSPRATIVLQGTARSWKQIDQPYRISHSYTSDQRHMFPQLQCHHLHKKHITDIALLQQGQERVFQIDLLKLCPSALLPISLSLHHPPLHVIHAAPDSVPQLLNWTCGLNAYGPEDVGYFTRGVFLRYHAENVAKIFQCS